MQYETQAKILYGVCQWSLPPLTPTVAAQTLVELGLDGIELDAGSWDGAQLGLADRGLQQQWLTACDQSALQIPALGMNALCGDGMSKSNKSKIVQAILTSGIAIAHEMKIPALQLPSFFDGAIKTARDLEVTAERLQEVCDLAEPYGIAIGTENVLTAEACTKLITLVARENLQIFFDTQNPWAMAGMDGRGILEEEYPFLYQAVHAKDGHGDQLSSALLGQGDSKFSETMSVFVENEYRGWFILENDYHSIPDATNWKTNVKTDLASIRAIVE